MSDREEWDYAGFVMDAQALVLKAEKVLSAARIMLRVRRARWKKYAGRGRVNFRDLDLLERYESGEPELLALERGLGMNGLQYKAPGSDTVWELMPPRPRKQLPPPRPKRTRAGKR